MHVINQEAETYGFCSHLTERPLIGGSYNPHNMEELVGIISTTEKGNARDHFGKDATA